MQCLKKWGFRRCEDICWVKTNIKNPGKKQHIDQKSIFQNTKVVLCEYSRWSTSLVLDNALALDVLASKSVASAFFKATFSVPLFQNLSYSHREAALLFNCVSVWVYISIMRIHLPDTFCKVSNIPFDHRPDTSLLYTELVNDPAAVK